MKPGFTAHGEWPVNGLRISRKRRGKASGDALPRAPGASQERSAVDDTRMSIWFEKQRDFYSGTAFFNTEFPAELATEGKAADSDDDGASPPSPYCLPMYDDEDQAHVSWSTIQIGIRNLASGGFIAAGHLHGLPSGTLNPDTGA